jgi:integrase
VKVDLKRRGEGKLTVGVDIPGKDDIQKLLAAAAGNRHRPLIMTAALTGMRASELRGLPWDAVDFEKKMITVRQRADEWGTIGSPKSAAGHREIPMAPPVFNTLREWKLACPKSELNLVFPNTLGKVQPLSNITQHGWRPLQQKSGLVDANGQPLFNFHTLRHFFASWAIEQGFTPKKLQALLGHSSIQMTFDRYGHLFPSLEDDHAKFARGAVGLVV